MSLATNKVLLLFFCVYFISSNAQNEFVTYTKSDGLTSSNILSVKVDFRGIIWAATSSGIVAFIDDAWVPIKSIVDSKGNNKNLGRVSKIFEALNGDLWVVTQKGLFVYNGSYWTNYFDGDNDGFVVTNIFEDRRGWIWIMLEKVSSLKDIGDIGFALVEGKVQTFNGYQWYKHLGEIGGSAAITVGNPMKYFTSNLQDQEGNIWITNQDGLYKFDGKKWHKFDEEELPSDICNKVIETENNDIWVATKYGIAKQNDDRWQKFQKTKGIKGNNTYDLFEDNQNKIWTITKKDNRFNSICVYENGSWSPYFKDDIKIKGSIRKPISFEDKVIVSSKKGISSFDGKNWTNLIKKFKIKDNLFTTITVTKDKSIWFSGQKGLYNMVVDSLKTIYIPKKNWKVTIIFESANGDLLVGTEKNGLFIINGNEVIQYTVDNGLNDNFIKDIFEDKQKNIWVITKGGISRLL